MKSVFGTDGRLMKVTGTIVGLAMSLVLPAGLAMASDQPYAGQDQRSAKTLSDTDVSDLLAGKGWGFAKPAELNGYPGPRHVLDLSDELELSADQIDSIQSIFDVMRRDAMELGRDYVEAERALDAVFAGGSATPATLAERTSAVERVRAALRVVHLQAHLQTRPLLTPHQVARYRHLRGYGGPTGHRHAH